MVINWMTSFPFPEHWDTTRALILLRDPTKNFSIDLTIKVKRSIIRTKYVPSEMIDELIAQSSSQVTT